MIDDETRLRYLQAQRQVRSLIAVDAEDGFVPEDVESDLQLYRRLSDDEAFDDWLGLGITTTVESTIADREAREVAEYEAKMDAAMAAERDRASRREVSVDSWAEFRTLFSRHLKQLANESPTNQMQLAATPEQSMAAEDRHINGKQVFRDTLDVVWEHVRSSKAVLVGQCLSHGFSDLQSMQDQVTREIHGLTQIGKDCQEWNIGGSNLEAPKEILDRCQHLRQAAEEMSFAMFNFEATLTAASDQLRRTVAVDAEDARAREELMAVAVLGTDELLVLSESVLEMNRLIQAHTIFIARRPILVKAVSEALESMTLTMTELETVEFKKRSDSLVCRTPELMNHLTTVLDRLQDLVKTPFGVDSHLAWQRKVADSIFVSLMEISRRTTGLSLSEINVGCSSVKAAARIKSWIGEGLTLPEVAFRQLRHDHLTMGASLCVCARFFLEELGNEFDEFWGFTPM